MILKKTKIIVPILLLILLLTGVSCSTQTDTTKPVTVIEEEEAWAESSKGKILPEWDAPSLTYTAAVPFKVGHKYTYVTQSDTSERKSTFIVESITNIDGKKYYHFIQHHKGRQQGDPSDPNWSDFDITGTTLYYDAENGKAFQMKDGKLEEIDKRGHLNSASIPLYYWMLALDDTFDWTGKYANPIDSRDRRLYRIRVTGREVIDGRDSFVVELGVNGRYINKYWIDINTRILLRMESAGVVRDRLIEAPFLKAK